MLSMGIHQVRVHAQPKLISMPTTGAFPRQPVTPPTHWEDNLSKIPHEPKMTIVVFVPPIREHYLRTSSACESEQHRQLKSVAKYVATASQLT